MPTYQNDYHKPVNVKNSIGLFVQLKPGETIETYYFSDDPRLTLTSDDPLYNRVISDDVLSLTATPQIIPVSLKTKYVVFLEITGSVTAYAQIATNEPPELRGHVGNVVIVIPAKGRFNKMVVTGAGSCRMVQYLDLDVV